MVKGAVSSRQLTVDEMMRGAVAVTKGVKVKVENQVIEIIDETEPVQLPELSLRVVEATRNVREVIYPVYSFHNVNF